MKLKSYFFTVAAACALFACSDNDPVVELPTAIEPDAILSLRIDAGNNVLTKGEADYQLLEETVNTLTVAVFNDGAYADALQDELVVFVADALDTEATNKDKSIQIPVRSGAIKVLVLANLSADVISQIEVGMTLDEFCALPTSLANEAEELTMSSRLLQLTAQRDKVNCLGFEKSGTAAMYNGVEIENGVSLVQTTPIELYRSIARVRLMGLEMQKQTKYGEAKKLEVKSIFMANVKGKSNLAAASKDNRGVLEINGPSSKTDKTAFWRFGENEYYEDGGVLSTIYAGNYLGDLYHESDIILTNDGTENKISVSDTEGEPAAYIGRPFYVYENTEVVPIGETDKNEATQTLLIIHGDYTYTPTGATETKVEDRYWAIVIHPDASEGHTYVRRNYSYNIKGVVLSGPGSTTPYSPDAFINVNAKVVVRDWDVVEMNEPIN